MKGWFKLHRKIFENPMWTERRKFSKFEAWIDILQMVSYSEKNSNYINGNYCEWGRGQYPVSISFLSERWGWSDKQVRTYLKRASRNKQITLKRASKWTMLTVCKYDNYQHQGQSEVKSEGNQGAIIKRSKELKEEYIELWERWMKYRIDIKHEITNDDTIEKLTKKFNAHSLKDCEYVVNLSIENQWRGLFWEKLNETKNHKQQNEVPNSMLPNMDYINEKMKLVEEYERKNK